jgi:hypothetical protein
MQMMTFKEHAQLDEAFPLAGLIGAARIISFGLTRAGINVAKIVAPFPFGGIKGAISGTVLGGIATKYGWDSIIATQAGGTQLVMDIAKALGGNISAAVAAAIFEKVLIIGATVTLGALLLVLVPAKTRKKVTRSIKGLKKKTLKMSDIKAIGKKIRNEKNI